MSVISQARQIYRREGFFSLILKSGVFLKNRLLFVLWNRTGILPFDRLYSQEYYQNLVNEEAMADSEAFVEQVCPRLDVDSVIDFGCGAGRFLAPFYRRDAVIHGIDASEDAQREAIVPQRFLEQHDLRDPYRTESTHDLALCIEVLEHLPAEAAPTAVRSIARSADAAIVTAATPGQGGTHHVNERPHEYWVSLFKSEGMEFDEMMTADLRESFEPSTLDWLTTNLLVFRNENDDSGN